MLRAELANEVNREIWMMDKYNLRKNVPLHPTICYDYCYVTLLLIFLLFPCLALSVLLPISISVLMTEWFFGSHLFSFQQKAEPIMQKIISQCSHDWNCDPFIENLLYQVQKKLWGKKIALPWHYKSHISLLFTWHNSLFASDN